LAHKVAMALTGGAARAREVWFSHAPISAKASYVERFGTTVRFNQQFDAIFLTGDDLRQQVIASDADAFRRECEAIKLRVEPASCDIVTLVRDYLRDNLAVRTIKRPIVAEYLGVSTRTLHRKLDEGGWTFESLRDDVRRSLLVRYLCRADLSLTEVAGQLGYSELAVLSRSCQRWFSCTPGALRARLLRDHLYPAGLADATA